MRNISYRCLLLAISTAALVGCSSEHKEGQPSPFAGTWLGKEEILAFRELGKDEERQAFVCDNIESSGGRYNLIMDGLVIQRSGDVYDFQIDGRHNGPVWRVGADGRTIDNQILKSNAQQGSTVLKAHAMKKLSTTEIASNWTYEEVAEMKTYVGDVRFVLVSDDEIQLLRSLVNNCKKEQ